MRISGYANYGKMYAEPGGNVDDAVEAMTKIHELTNGPDSPYFFRISTSHFDLISQTEVCVIMAYKFKEVE